MSLRLKTVSWSWWLSAALALSCSVFPDEATLPSAAAGAGGSSVLPQSGAGAEGGQAEPVGGGGTTEGGAPSSAGGGVGASSGAGAGAPPLGMAGSDAGGAGGAPACASPRQSVIAVSADSWIEAAKPTSGHGDDAVLSVVGGGQERRALLELTLPAAKAGAILLEATLVVHLQANADIGRMKRQLRLHQLEHPVMENRATWNRWDNGASGNWKNPGGDFGVAIAEAEVAAGTAAGIVGFDVTTIVGRSFATVPVPLSLILLETSAPPPAPADLAFTSSEGDASGVPALIVEFCEP